MHGLGNDFVVIDGINQRVKLTAETVQRLADRRYGVGCDQVLIVEATTHHNVDFRYRIFNQDGSEVENCGNGARCFAKFVRDQQLTNKSSIVVETCSGEMTLNVQGDGQVTVNMGIPELDPAKIPFTVEERQETYQILLPNGEHVTIRVVSMGNPHAVLQVEDVKQAEVGRIGPEVEKHRKFPKGVNVGFMAVKSRREIDLRVFERGAGETLACGTGACAAVVAGRLANLLDEEVCVNFPGGCGSGGREGGCLSILWSGEGHPVLMTGPAETTFTGQIHLE